MGYLSLFLTHTFIYLPPFPFFSPSTKTKKQQEQKGKRKKQEEPATPAKKKSKKKKSKKKKSLSVAEKAKEFADFFPSYTPFRKIQPGEDKKNYAIELNDYLNVHGMLWCHECKEEKQQKDFSKDKQNTRNHLHKKNCKVCVGNKAKAAHEAGGARPCGGMNHQGEMVDATKFSPFNVYCCTDCVNAYHADPVNKCRRNKWAREQYKFNYTSRIKNVRNVLPIIPDIILSF